MHVLKQNKFRPCLWEHIFQYNLMENARKLSCRLSGYICLLYTSAAIENNVTNRAAGVIMDVNTGEILAMATKSDFNPNSPFEITDQNVLNSLSSITDEEEYSKAKNEALQESWRNKVVSDTYEPGSVFKAVTASMALEEKVVTPVSYTHLDVYKRQHR